MGMTREKDLVTGREQIHLNQNCSNYNGLLLEQNAIWWFQTASVEVMFHGIKKLFLICYCLF